MIMNTTAPVRRLKTPEQPAVAAAARRRSALVGFLFAIATTAFAQLELPATRPIEAGNWPNPDAVPRVDSSLAQVTQLELGRHRKAAEAAPITPAVGAPVAPAGDAAKAGDYSFSARDLDIRDALALLTRSSSSVRSVASLRRP